MGYKTKLTRKIKFFYEPEFLVLWNETDKEHRELLAKMGKPFGWSGMNALYIMLVMYCVIKYGPLDKKFYDWRKSA